jgi:hypothetical protein
MSADLFSLMRARVLDPANRTDMGQARELPSLATSEQVAETEQRLGYTLPPLLVRAYREIGNGGWGPGYGLMGIVGGFEGDSGDRTAIDHYETFRGDDPEDPGWKWPAGLLPINDWGCAIRTCIDCTSPLGAVWTFDPNSTRTINDPIERCLAKTHESVAAWFEDWVSGMRLWDVMFEVDEEGSKVGVNPFTKQPAKVVQTRLRRWK